MFAKSTTNACSAIWWPKLELMKIEKEKVEKSWRKKLKRSWEKVEKTLRQS